MGPIIMVTKTRRMRRAREMKSRMFEALPPRPLYTAIVWCFSTNEISLLLSNPGLIALSAHLTVVLLLKRKDEVVPDRN